MCVCFSKYNNVYPKYCNSQQNMSFNKIRDFILEKYCKRIGFPKENSYYSMKLLKEKFIVTYKQTNKKYT